MFRIAFTTKKRRPWTIKCQREMEIFLNHKGHLFFHCSLWWGSVQEPRLRTTNSPQTCSPCSLGSQHLRGRVSKMNRTGERPWVSLRDFGRSVLLCVWNIPFPLREGEKCLPVQIGHRTWAVVSGNVWCRKARGWHEGKDGREEEKISQLSIKIIKVEVVSVLS